MTVSDSSASVAPGAGRAAPRVPLIAFVYLAIIVLTWAGNWPLMKLALGQVPPLKFVLLRLVGSLVLIAPAQLAARRPLLPYRGERHRAVSARVEVGDAT
jgi:drug/metabolite transporter (DMT)-like permease